MFKGVGKMRSFGIEWKKTGRLMIGSPWIIENGRAPVDFPHKLTLPESLWSEYRSFLLSLGAVLDDAGLIDGAGALADEVGEPPKIKVLRNRNIKVTT